MSCQRFCKFSDRCSLAFYYILTMFTYLYRNLLHLLYHGSCTIQARIVVDLLHCTSASQLDC